MNNDDVIAPECVEQLRKRGLMITKVQEGLYGDVAIVHIKPVANPKPRRWLFTEHLGGFVTMRSEDDTERFGYAWRCRMPSDAPKRDPRCDPKAGDIFAGADGRVREVTCVANYVVYSFQFGWKKYHVLIHSWRKWAETARVIHAAD